MELKSNDFRDTLSVKDLQHNSHLIATKSGFHEVEKTALEAHMLVVTEVAEASEAVRSGEPYIYKVLGGVPITPDDERFYTDGALLKPEGEAVELADAVIRIADYFGQIKVDLETVLRIKTAYNMSRDYMHGREI